GRGQRPRFPRPGDRHGGGQGAPEVRRRRDRDSIAPVDLLAGERGLAAFRVRSGADPQLPDRQAAEPREERDGRIGPPPGAETFIGSPPPSRAGREFLDEPGPSPPELQYQPPPMMPPPRRIGGISHNRLVLLSGLFMGLRM